VSFWLDFSSAKARQAVNDYAIAHYRTMAALIFASLAAEPEDAEIVPESNYLHFFSFFEFVPYALEITRFPRVLCTVRFSTEGNRLIRNFSAVGRFLRNRYEVEESRNVAKLRLTLAGQRNPQPKNQKLVVNTRSFLRSATRELEKVLN
jgi:hypothetical protein